MFGRSLIIHWRCALESFFCPLPAPSSSSLPGHHNGKAPTVLSHTTVIEQLPNPGTPSNFKTVSLRHLPQ